MSIMPVHNLRYSQGSIEGRGRKNRTWGGSKSDGERWINRDEAHCRGVDSSGEITFRVGSGVLS